MSRRENTFRIDYANVPKKPSFDDVHEFVGSVLGMKHEEVKRLQCSRSLGCAFVKASDLEVAQRVVEEHDNKHDLTVDGKLYRLRLRMEDGAKEVKLYDLSENVSDDEIAKFLQAYGDVLSISEELIWGEKYRFGRISSGVRIVRMMVKQNIPSNVIIDGELTSVSYYGQRHTCRHCGEYGHSGISCVQNKKLLIQKMTADKSYASVTGSGTGPKPKPTPSFIKPKPGPAALPLLTPQPQLQPKSTTMPPPPSPSMSTSSPLPTNNAENLQEPQTNVPKVPSQLAAIGGNSRSSDKNDKNDGEETDGSTTSTSSQNSRRPPGKKMRHDKSQQHLKQ